MALALGDTNSPVVFAFPTHRVRARSASDGLLNPALALGARIGAADSRAVVAQCNGGVAFEHGQRGPFHRAALQVATVVVPSPGEHVA